MNFLKQQILRLENGGGKNLPWRRAFNLALRGGEETHCKTLRKTHQNSF